MDHRGQLVVARIEDSVEDPKYKYWGKIEIGPLSQRECYIGHRGPFGVLEGTALVRLEEFDYRRSRMRLDDVLTAQFITSNIPENFEGASSDQAIVYGPWEARMKHGFSVPIIESISDFYDVGITHSVQHFQMEGAKVIPHRIYSRNFYRSEIDELARRQQEPNEPRDVRAVLGRYLDSMNKMHETYPFPRMATFDKDTSLEEKLIQAIHSFVESGEYNISWAIEMEPQQ